MKREKEKKEKRTMDFILIIVGILLVSFTIAMIILFQKYGSVPDTLITCVFAALAGECGVMGIIKTTKIRYEDREWYKEDRKYERKRNMENN